MKTTLFAGASVGLCVMAFAGAASAQSIDYGSLQQLFNEPVTTSATGSPQRSTETPADMTIISADDIRRSGETSLPGIIARVAGIDTLPFSAGQTDIAIRGYNQNQSPRVLVLVNGRQVYEDLYGEMKWSTIPVAMSEIRQIEVVRGPAAALFGFNAVSGVVNIITYSPKFDDVNKVELRTGSDEYRSASLVGTLRLGPLFAARLSVSGDGQREWARRATLPLITSIHSPTRAAANLDIVSQLTANTELRLETSWSNVGLGTPVPTSYTRSKTLTRSTKATLTSETHLGLIQASAYKTDLAVKYPFGRYSAETTVANLQDLFKIGANHTLRASIEYRKNEGRVATRPDLLVGFEVLAPAAMWDWKITDKLTATTAVRFDTMTLSREGGFLVGDPLGSNSYWNDRTIKSTSGNFTLAWRPTDNDSVRLSWGRGAQSPSLIELGLIDLRLSNGGGVFRHSTGNPQLDPAFLNQWELAVDRKVAFIKGEVGLRLFSQDWKGLKGGFSTDTFYDLPANGTKEATSRFSNLTDSKMKGFELVAKGRVTEALGWHGDYTYTDVKDTPFAGVSAAKTLTRRILFAQTTPTSRGNVGFDWTRGPWAVDADLRYVSDFKSYSLVNGALEPIKAYTTLSARAGYTLKNGIEIAISGQNLGEGATRVTQGLQAERRWQVSVSKSW